MAQWQAQFDEQAEAERDSCRDKAKISTNPWPAESSTEWTITPTPVDKPAEDDGIVKARVSMISRPDYSSVTPFSRPRAIHSANTLLSSSSQKMLAGFTEAHDLLKKLSINGNENAIDIPDHAIRLADDAERNGQTPTQLLLLSLGDHTDQQDRNNISKEAAFLLKTAAFVLLERQIAKASAVAQAAKRDRRETLAQAEDGNGNGDGNSRFVNNHLVAGDTNTSTPKAQDLPAIKRLTEAVETTKHLRRLAHKLEYYAEHGIVGPDVVSEVSLRTPHSSSFSCGN